MPAGDRTGPMGRGPMTGRGAGYCAGYDAPGYTNPMPGRGFGMGRGGAWGGGWGRGRSGGRGRRHWYHATDMPGWARFGYAPAWGMPHAAPPTPEQELQYLRGEAEWLREELDAITQRIEELEQAS